MRLINRCQTCGNWVPEFGVRGGSLDPHEWSGWGWCSAYKLSETIYGFKDGGSLSGRLGFEDVLKGKYLTYYLNSCDILGSSRYTNVED